jgi:hypothetical protein
MEQYISCAVDSSLLQRVSKIREHMGLEVLPTEISVSELDPLLVHLLQKEEGNDLVVDANITLQEQQRYWLAFCEKWNTWLDWE